MSETSELNHETQIIDHLFRHQYGKLVSILTRIFGLSHLETIEDSVQDTFMRATLSWRNNVPENPEAWLTKAAKNRAIDLLRKIKADNTRVLKFDGGPSTVAFDDFFLDHEIDDSQLRMIFTACHPQLNPKDQIAFALKTIAGFSQKEIASALLLKEETIKKRLTRARQTITKQGISFTIPNSKQLPGRLTRVLEVIYLIFNEGFHSNRKDFLIHQELCGEAIRLCRIILKNKGLRNGEVYALFALLCFQSSRLESRTNDEEEIIDLKNQDRSKWYTPLIRLGHDAMVKAVEYNDQLCAYHYEAAIVSEHLRASSFEYTDWDKILNWTVQLYNLQPSALTATSKAFVLLQLNRHDKAYGIINTIDPLRLEQRAYLYYGTMAEYFVKTNDISKAKNYLEKAMNLVTNSAEKNYLERKKKELSQV